MPRTEGKILPGDQFTFHCCHGNRRFLEARHEASDGMGV